MYKVNLKKAKSLTPNAGRLRSDCGTKYCSFGAIFASILGEDKVPTYTQEMSSIVKTLFPEHCGLVKHLELKGISPPAFGMDFDNDFNAAKTQKEKQTVFEAYIDKFYNIGKEAGVFE